MIKEFLLSSDHIKHLTTSLSALG